MYNKIASAWLCSLGGRPAYQIWGRARPEKRWRRIHVFASHRRNWDSRWPAPLFRGTAITWTSHVIAVGWDLAIQVYREQLLKPASPNHPQIVLSGRLNDQRRRLSQGFSPMPTASEIIAHECGHTRQAYQLEYVFLPAGALFTLFREGNSWYNHFENIASEQGEFGGIIPGTLHPSLIALSRQLNQLPFP